MANCGEGGHHVAVAPMTLNHLESRAPLIHLQQVTSTGANPKGGGMIGLHSSAVRLVHR